LHCYHEVHGRLPPAVVYGADDKTPLYSWRVLLLPFIEEERLYQEFALDEPWDSPHNLPLLERMPRIYAVPPGKTAKVPTHHTVCHFFVGQGTAFEGRYGLRIPADFPGGTARTFLIVEAGEPVPWTKPAELAYDPDRPLPDFRGIFQDGFRARMVDCSARWVQKGTSEAALRAAITRGGGDGLVPDRCSAVPSSGPNSTPAGRFPGASREQLRQNLSLAE
jgi:hypothetical protein